MLSVELNRDWVFWPKLQSMRSLGPTYCRHAERPACTTDALWRQIAGHFYQRGACLQELAAFPQSCGLIIYSLIHKVECLGAEPHWRPNSDHPQRRCAAKYSSGRRAGAALRLLLLVYEEALHVSPGQMMDVPAFHCGRWHGQQVSIEECSCPSTSSPSPESSTNKRRIVRLYVGQAIDSLQAAAAPHSHCRTLPSPGNSFKVATATSRAGRTPPLTLCTPHTMHIPPTIICDIKLRAAWMPTVVQAQCNLPPSPRRTLTFPGCFNPACDGGRDEREGAQGLNLAGMRGRR